ncbi:phage late control D family protein [Pseudoalteromonas luteoviolacea]|uniref:Late control protein D n=1 Tax=Pseudoalteromonas luteoviolacea NCIMB 1942 TaxID=1365253 RepID=A0A166Z710_9GAMM|nr:phage late control D family protein [Pseudoalteromonas luteoviolacea]KZN44005.1 late control protein D [Pseudoalteromonas luteoviolacea NCIMB 1942]
MTPDYQLTVDGKNIRLNGQLISLILTDNRGFEADTIEIQLDDSADLLDIPRKGAKMQVKLGYVHNGKSELTDKGSYTIDEVEHTGAPDTLTIRGKSADMRGSLLKTREQSFHQVTLDSIVQTIAQRNNLAAKISPTLSAEQIEHIDQTNESDAQFLTRLAEQLDAIATVKNDNLMFIAAGQAVSASGQPLPKIHITRQSGDQHRFSIADRQAYAGVTAYWQNERASRRESITVERSGNNGELTGGDGIKTLRHIYASRATATRAAKAMWERIQRGIATFSLTLAEGNPELFPETPITVSGFKPQIDNSNWILVQVTHTLNSAGYTSSLELEIKQDEQYQISEQSSVSDGKIA